GIGGGGSGWGISRSTAGKKRSKSSSGGPGDGPAHPFPTDYCDHFETPLRAYRDAEPVLVGLAAALGKARAELQIWDPFFCAGRTPRLLAQLGFTSVHHENVDFYEVIRQGAVPPHDVFVTNPPYSGNHKRRCLEFCAASGKPWLLLMPNYVATKDYYRSSALTRTPASATGRFTWCPPCATTLTTRRGPAMKSPHLHPCGLSSLAATPTPSGGRHRREA
ncbi:unnamed protein product, partial [Phaeothamnion confervicola]